MTTFIRFHNKNKPFMVNIDGIFSFHEKLKGIGSVVTDNDGETFECDETIDDIAAGLGEVEVEVIEFAND